jgi:hypothetical protein
MLLLALAAPVSAAGTPAAGGVRLLEAMESGAVVVVGRMERVERLDTHSYAAHVTIETVLGSPSESVDESGPIRIAWEELSTGRPPRFANGDRVLVCLEPLGSASIWTQRIPDPTTREHTAGIAMNGDAFLRQPGLGAVDVLHHYLSLTPEDRETTTGVGHLVSLAKSARPPLAASAARRLATVEELDSKLTARTAAKLTRALAREDLESDFARLWSPALSEAESPRLERALRDAVRRNLGSPRLFEALASVGGLSEADAAVLRSHEDPRYRVVLARTSPDPAVLRSLIRGDPAAPVRSAALARLVKLQRTEALEDALAALADADAGVRAVAARRAGDLGNAAVSGLESVAYGTFEPCAGSLDAPRSAIAGLSRSGTLGRRALAKIAREHPDESLRLLARIALGELETHVH